MLVRHRVTSNLSGAVNICLSVDGRLKYQHMLHLWLLGADAHSAANTNKNRNLVGLLIGSECKTIHYRRHDNYECCLWSKQCAPDYTHDCSPLLDRGY